MKAKLLELCRSHLAALLQLQRRVKASGVRIQDKAQLAAVQAVAAEWFDSVRPALETAQLGSDLLESSSSPFVELIKAAKIRPRKAAVLKNIADAIDNYNEKIIHPIEIGSFAPASSLNISPFIEGLTHDEGEYLAEAQRCLNVDALRGCIVLGWCATIARIHARIEDIGFDVFSKATADMFDKATGRFKPFKKKFQIESRSELQRVFDTDLLWVLEYMELIDGNQHEQLRHCFEFRNNSAHPGLAPIKGPNLYSFYSDISEIVLKNPKFALRTEGPGSRPEP